MAIAVIDLAAAIIVIDLVSVDQDLSNYPLVGSRLRQVDLDFPIAVIGLDVVAVTIMITDLVITKLVASNWYQYYLEELSWFLLDSTMLDSVSLRHCPIISSTLVLQDCLKVL